jgi:hypothetical protein
MARRIVMAHRGSINLIQTSGGWFTIVMRLPELAMRSALDTYEEKPA